MVLAVILARAIGDADLEALALDTLDRERGRPFNQVTVATHVEVAVDAEHGPAQRQPWPTTRHASKSGRSEATTRCTRHDFPQKHSRSYAHRYPTTSVRLTVSL